MPETTKDIFICHAGEDKEHVARPLAQKLEAAGISCWFDEAMIHWGESIVAKVNEGLNSSRFVIVVLSQAFVQKNWPKRELISALHAEAGSGQVRVLPLLVGNETQRDQILEQFPLLQDKNYLVWDGSGENVLRELRPWLSQSKDTQGNPTTEARQTAVRIEALAR